MRTAYMVAGTTDYVVPAKPRSRDSGAEVKEASFAYLIDPSYEYVQIAIQASIVSGAPTFQIEATLDEIQPCGPLQVYTEAQAHWTPVSGLTGLTAATLAEIALPCRGVRVKVTDGEGVVMVAVTQGGGHV